MTNALILIIEDEPEIADILRRYFEREGFRTVHAADGETGLSHHLLLKPDLVVLDVKLPRWDGYEVLSILRQRGDTPVIMVTALTQDLDKLQALHSGADDYVVKPFNPLEVVARAKAVLRRAGHSGKRIMRVGALLIDMNAHTVTVETREGRQNLNLTRTEFRLLVHMAQSPNRVFDRGELVDACLPEGDAVDRTVDSHISKLRRKLIDAGVHDQLIGVRGVGYRLEGRFE